MSAIISDPSSEKMQVMLQESQILSLSNNVDYVFCSPFKYAYQGKYILSPRQLQKIYHGLIFEIQYPEIIDLKLFLTKGTDRGVILFQGRGSSSYTIHIHQNSLELRQSTEIMISFVILLSKRPQSRDLEVNYFNKRNFASETDIDLVEQLNLINENNVYYLEKCKQIHFKLTSNYPHL